MTRKRLRKITQQSLLIFCILKKWKYVQLWYYLPVKKLSALLKGINAKNNGDF